MAGSELHPGRAQPGRHESSQDLLHRRRRRRRQRSKRRKRHSSDASRRDTSQVSRRRDACDASRVAGSADDPGCEPRDHHRRGGSAEAAEPDGDSTETPENERAAEILLLRLQHDSGQGSEVGFEPLTTFDYLTP